MDTIRRATLQESARLTEIAHAAKSHWGYPRAWIRQWRDQLTLTAEYLAAHHVEVAEVDATVAGFYALEQHGTTAELGHLWVDPAFIGKGLGRKLFEHALAVCRDRGIEHIEIDSDPHAEAFYLHLGARRTGKTPAPVEGDAERYLPRLALEIPPLEADR